MGKILLFSVVGVLMPIVLWGVVGKRIVRMGFTHCARGLDVLPNFLLGMPVLAIERYTFPRNGRIPQAHGSHNWKEDWKSTLARLHAVS